MARSSVPRQLNSGATTTSTAALHKILSVLVRVVPTEDKLATTGEDDTQLSGGVAPIAALFGGGGSRGLGRRREGGGHRLLLVTSCVDGPSQVDLFLT